MARWSSGKRIRTVLPRLAAGGTIRDGDEKQSRAEQSSKTCAPAQVPGKLELAGKPGRETPKCPKSVPPACTCSGKRRWWGMALGPVGDLMHMQLQWSVLIMYATQGNTYRVLRTLAGTQVHFRGRCIQRSGPTPPDYILAILGRTPPAPPSHHLRLLALARTRCSGCSGPFWILNFFLSGSTS